MERTALPHRSTSSVATFTMNTGGSKKRPRLLDDPSATNSSSSSACSSTSCSDMLPKRLVLPKEVWPSICSFLDIKTTGRFLLWTSKVLSKSILGSTESSTGADDDDDAVWKILLKQMWGSTAATELLDATGWTAEGCLRLLGYAHFFSFLDESLTIDRDSSSLPLYASFSGRQAWTMPRPLLYSPDEYLVVVSLKLDYGTYPKCKSAYCCKSFRGSQIPDFFATGKGSIEFADPIWKTINEREEVREEGDAHQYGHGANIGYATCITLVHLPSQKMTMMGKNKGYTFVGDLKDYWGKPHFQWDNLTEWNTQVANMTYPYGTSLMRHLELRTDAFCVRAIPRYRKVTTKITDDSFGLVGFELAAKFCKELQDADEVDASDLFRQFPRFRFPHVLEALALRDWRQKLEEIKTEVYNKQTTGVSSIAAHQEYGEFSYDEWSDDDMDEDTESEWSDDDLVAELDSK